MRRIQTFEVSLKAFIRNDDRVLLVREADTGCWELPGGRIDVGEEFEPHESILRREIAEELGPGFTVEIGARSVSFVRQRPVDGVYQFIVARACRHIAGVERLSAEHDALRWITHAEVNGLAFPPNTAYASALAALWQFPP